MLQTHRTPYPCRATRALPILACLLSLATASFGQLAAEASDSANLTPDTVRAHLQTRPGGPVEEATVPISRGPSSLPTAGAKDIDLQDDDLVLGVVIAGRAKAYPIRYLAPYEVVADRLGDQPIAPTWCPLSGSGVVFARRVGERELSFDFVRGLLHDNLLISDRETRSVWSQLEGKAIAGPLAGQELKIVPSLQTTWGFWKRRHPQTEVLYIDGSDGFPYRYFESDELRMPPLSSQEHDPTSLGLGLMIWGQPTFFPLRELAKAPDPFTIGSGSLAIHIRHDGDGKTAWAEDAEGNTLGAVLVYERSWKAVHPTSRIFEAALDCGPGPGRG